MIVLKSVNTSGIVNRAFATLREHVEYCALRPAFGVLRDLFVDIYVTSSVGALML